MYKLQSCNQFLQCKENELRIDVYHKQSLWNCFSNLLLFGPCGDMFKVISDIIAHCYEISISAMQRKWIVHWYLSYAIIMEENVWLIYYS